MNWSASLKDVLVSGWSRKNIASHRPNVGLGAKSGALRGSALLVLYTRLIPPGFEEKSGVGM